MQLGKISSCDINVNPIKSSCVCKPCNYNLKPKRINDNFIFSKGKNISFGSFLGKVCGSAKCYAVASTVIAATGGIAH